MLAGNRGDLSGFIGYSAGSKDGKMSRYDDALKDGQTSRYSAGSLRQPASLGRCIAGNKDISVLASAVKTLNLLTAPTVKTLRNLVKADSKCER